MQKEERWRVAAEYRMELKYLGVFWLNQVQMGHNVVGRWRVGGGLQVP